MQRFFSKNIQALLKEKDLSKNAVAKKAKIPYTSFLQMLRGKFSPNESVQKRLAKALAIPLRELKQWVAQDKLNKDIPELRTLMTTGNYQIEGKGKKLVLKEQQGLGYHTLDEIIAAYLHHLPNASTGAVKKFLKTLPTMSKEEIRKVNTMIKKYLQDL